MALFSPSAAYFNCLAKNDDETLLEERRDRNSFYGFLLLDNILHKSISCAELHAIDLSQSIDWDIGEQETFGKIKEPCKKADGLNSIPIVWR